MRETFEQEYVRCGKPGCRRCPHGPYWYAYRREGGKVRKRYVGKDDPRVKADASPNQVRQPLPDPREAIFSGRTATLSLAEAILGVKVGEGRDKCLSAYRMLSMTNHPDRGGDEQEMRYINAAWSYMRAAKGWK